MKLLPRKKDSKKSSDLPKEFLRNVEQLFAQQFKKSLQGAEILCGAQLYSEEIQFCVSICRARSLAGASIYVSSDIPKETFEKPEMVTEVLKSMVDIIASWLSQTLSNEAGLESLVQEIQKQGKSWQSFEWEKQAMYIRFDKTNMVLEKAADDFLSKQGFDPDEGLEE